MGEAAWVSGVGSDPLSVDRNYESDGAALVIRLCYMAKELYTGLINVDFEIV